jgi:hypothetical protein
MPQFAWVRVGSKTHTSSRRCFQADGVAYRRHGISVCVNKKLHKPISGCHGRAGLSTAIHTTRHPRLDPTWIIRTGLDRIAPQHTISSTYRCACFRMNPRGHWLPPSQACRHAGIPWGNKGNVRPQTAFARPGLLLQTKKLWVSSVPAILPGHTSAGPVRHPHRGYPHKPLQPSASA